MQKVKSHGTTSNVTHLARTSELFVTLKWEYFRKDTWIHNYGHQSGNAWASLESFSTYFYSFQIFFPFPPAARFIIFFRVGVLFFMFGWENVWIKWTTLCHLEDFLDFNVSHVLIYSRNKQATESFRERRDVCVFVVESSWERRIQIHAHFLATESLTTRQIHNFNNDNVIR